MFPAICAARVITKAFILADNSKIVKRRSKVHSAATRRQRCEPRRDEQGRSPETVVGCGPLAAARLRQGDRCGDRHVERADPAHLRYVGDPVHGRQRGRGAAVVLVADRQADRAVQGRVEQRDRARGELDRDDPEAVLGRLLDRVDRDGVRYADRNRSVPSAVLPTAGRSRSGVLPHSQTDSTPNAAAVLMIEPTLNGWPTESSSSARRPSVRRRHSRLSRFTSVGRSCLGGPPAVRRLPPRARCHFPSGVTPVRSKSSAAVTRSRR